MNRKKVGPYLERSAQISYGHISSQINRSVLCVHSWLALIDGKDERVSVFEP